MEDIETYLTNKYGGELVEFIKQEVNKKEGSGKWKIKYSKNPTLAGYTRDDVKNFFDKFGDDKIMNAYNIVKKIAKHVKGSGNEKVKEDNEKQSIVRKIRGQRKVYGRKY